jgi:hypothetical protein
MSAVPFYAFYRTAEQTATSLLTYGSERDVAYQASSSNKMFQISHYFLEYMCVDMGTAVAHWLRYCATNRKVAGSISDSVIGIFH